MDAETNPEETGLDQDQDPLHIGNLVEILSELHGYVVGHVVYRDASMVRIMPQEASDRAIEFPMRDNAFNPELGISTIEVLERQPSDYYVDFLGVKPGELLEFFTADGTEAAPVGEVAELIKSKSKDSIRLVDGRVIKFRGIGPEPPIAVVRVRTAITDAAAAEEGVPVTTTAAVDSFKRDEDILALLRSVLPTATVNTIPTTERKFPDSMQREDLFQDLLNQLSAKQRTNPRRVKAIEREVDLALALKTHVSVEGVANSTISTIAEAVEATTDPLPAAIPIVEAARVLNLEETVDTEYKSTDITPRLLADIETQSETTARMYEDGALPAGLGRTFAAYIYDLLSRDQATLEGPAPTSWTTAQDVIRTAGLGVAVQGLSRGLPRTGDAEAAPVSVAFRNHNVTDRSIRVLGSSELIGRKTGTVQQLAPSDPSKVIGYVILPHKAAQALRPSVKPGHLPTAISSAMRLEADTLPSVTKALTDLYASTSSPLNAWTLDATEASSFNIAEWLDAVLKYAVHPVDSLGPRTPAILALLDTFGLEKRDLSPEVKAVLDRWIQGAQKTWDTLFAAERARIKELVDSEGDRTFQNVTGIDSPTWTTVRGAPSLKQVIEDIERRNPSIAGSAIVLVAALLMEAQGDAAPLVWISLASQDLGIDAVNAAAALQASRAYILRRQALRGAALLGLRAEPIVNNCPHVKRLEAIRNQRDVLTRSRILRDFVEEYQGSRGQGANSEWITCTLCSEPCVCYHELMELEALAQPSRMDAIQKQILVKYGGERYEGKIICRNCGQPLQDIDYDEHVEFDDNGRPIVERSVLTADQLEETTETTWKKDTASLIAAPIQFASESQRLLLEALTTILERGGLNANEDVIRMIVRYADLYVSARSPSQAIYEAQRTKLLTAASTKLKTGTTGGTIGSVPTYSEILDNLRVTALTGLTAVALQSAVPPIAVNNPFPLCKFSREGWPMNATAKPDEGGATLYMACVVASIQRDAAPWRNLSWNGEPKIESRRKKVLKATVDALTLMLVGDSKTGSLSFTPELRSALSKAQTDVVAAKERALVSLTDQLPAGFRPEPFPPKVGRPAVERDPVLALRNTSSDSRSAIGKATKQQAMAVISELHADAAAFVDGMTGQKPTSLTDSVCCPVPFGIAEQGALLGKPEQTRLLEARRIVRGSQPFVTNAGTHLWEVQAAPLVSVVEQHVAEDVYFKLFLKYCYRGPQVGDVHEFSVGNICRQCGLRLGKPIDTIDVGIEGAGILAAQQGDLKVEITKAAFDALSDAVRRRKLLTPQSFANQLPWTTGLAAIAVVCKSAESSNGISEALTTVLEAISARPNTASKEVDAVERAMTWSPITVLKDTLYAEVLDALGAQGPQAMAVFEQMTEDPFLEGPRAIQEYWCAKTEAVGTTFGVREVRGAKWFNISRQHNERINKVLRDNTDWFTGEVTDGMRKSLRSIGLTLGPQLRVWVRAIRPAISSTTAGFWTIEEARLVLQTLVLQVWRDAVSMNSWMLRDVVTPVERENTVRKVAAWTSALLKHVKQQFVRYSKERISQILQQRAELERTSVVEEFEAIRDDDQRAAELIKKQLRIGRWGVGGQSWNKYDPETFEFENEQRKRMGIVDLPVDPILLDPAAAAGAQDYGLALVAGLPEDGYDVAQGADGDDY